jgi:hypothetical protein
MIEHFPQLFLEDRTSFFTLQEGSENFIGKLENISSFGQHGPNRARQILEHAIALSTLELFREKATPMNWELLQERPKPLLDRLFQTPWVTQAAQRLQLLQ